MPAITSSPDHHWQHAHQWPVRVYYEDTDAGGVVFYANYLKFMERGRTEWLRALRISQQNLALTQGIVFVVSQLDMQYKMSARLDDALMIETLVTYAGCASINFAQRILREHDIIAQGNIRVGCVDVSSMRPTALPFNVRDQISTLHTR
uniref:tol-pal system-associated acyl-CoA thioesterase n=1 Tax=Orrella sp. TaxID=1921583 RepID=UPI004047B145